jgi:hypothetical protein
MPHANSTSYVNGLTHPESWIHDNDQVLLIVGMSWWYLLALLLGTVFVCVFSRIRRMPMVVSGAARILAYCLTLGVIYMYTSAREFLFVREDDVIVRTWMVLANGGIQTLLIYVGSIHCVLAPVPDRWTLWLGLFANAQTVLASFAAAEQQWAGWIIGAACNTPIPFIWLFMQRRDEARRFEPHTIVWIIVWLAYRTAYALLQLCGHTFDTSGGLETTAELALTLVLHAATLAPLVYAAKMVREPPPAPGTYSRRLATGDLVSTHVDD